MTRLMHRSRAVDGVAGNAGTSDSLRDLTTRIENGIFLRSTWFDEWCLRATIESSIGILSIISLAIKSLFGADNGRWAIHRTIRRVLANRSAFRDEANERIIQTVIHANAKFFDTIETYPLTTRQREAVASDEDATLVIAGAGTGKTSTILAKIGLLLVTGQCAPKEILAISFTKKSAKELADRIQEKLGVELDIQTFHKLGLGVIARGEGKKPRLAPFVEDPAEKIKHLDRLISQLKEDESFRKRLVRFVAYHRLPVKEMWNFASLAEYKGWLQSNRVVSLDGVPKKSYQECIIANWLLMNGVRFIYEDAYEHDTRTIDRRQYCPDFHILEPNLYIEHFGVDENNDPAPYIDADEYRQSMAWKRETHRKHKTALIETFSWESSKGLLIKKLEQKLTVRGCKLAPITDQDALEMMNKSGVISGFAELVGSFLALYKGNGSRLIDPTVKTALFGYEREQAFLEIFDALFSEYERQNQVAGQIDFEDMIARATSIVRSGRFVSPYKYVLVDEFQDVSPGRAELVHALQHAVADCALFAVGDDWQSIYRFAGSDIGAMTHFHTIFGVTHRVPLDTTFRFDNFAIQTSSRFVLKNQAQISKALKAVKTGEVPSVVIYKRKENEPPLDWILTQITADAKGPATVLVLERYNFHLPDEQEKARLQKLFPTLSVETMSVHGSKGLEADFVIVGLRGGQWGFPATKSDDPLLTMVLTQADKYPYGEERRLFYVALTRARRKTFLVCETGQDQSMFAAELESEKEYRVDVLGVDTKKLACTKCKSGTMMLRDGSNGKFYGCSNFPLCNCTQQTCPQCRVGLLIQGDGRQWKCHHCDYTAQVCPRCKTGVLLERSGQYGSFIGCSNFRDPELNCRYTGKSN